MYRTNSTYFLASHDLHLEFLMEILAFLLIPLHLLLGLTHFFLQHVQQRTLLYGGHFAIAVLWTSRTEGDETDNGGARTHGTDARHTRTQKDYLQNENGKQKNEKNNGKYVSYRAAPSQEASEKNG